MRFRLFALCALQLTFSLRVLFELSPVHADAPASAIKAVADAKLAAAIEERRRYEPYGYRIHPQEANIAGRALNEQGEPVAEARVVIVNVAPRNNVYGEKRFVAETKTDAKGNYRFEKISLPVLEFPPATPRPREALFQVFAMADGYGYVWRRPHALRPGSRANPSSLEDSEQAATEVSAAPIVYSDEPIQIDLMFSPEVVLHGLLTNDQGTPLKDALVQAGLINTDRDRPGAAPRMWNISYHNESPRREDGQFQGQFELPERFRQTRTDAEGRYEIRGLPRDCHLLTFMDYRPEYDPHSTTIMTGSTDLPGGGKLAFSGELNQVFVAPITVKVRVTDGDDQPLANVVVRRDSSGKVRRGGSLDRTNADGIATLMVRPGKSPLQIEPTFDQPYLPRQVECELIDGQGDVGFHVQLEPAAEVIFEAVESGSGKPVAGIAFLDEPPNVAARLPVQSILSLVDYPHTDETGAMRAFLAPGMHRFFVDQRHSSSQFDTIVPTTDEIDLSIEKPTRVRFEFTRRANKSDIDLDSIPSESRALYQTLVQQRARFQGMQRMRFRLRNHNHLQGTMTREALTALFDSFPSKSLDECVTALTDVFPDFRRAVTVTMVSDGNKRRVEFHGTEYHEGYVNVCNGEEVLYPMDANRQLDIYAQSESRIHFLSREDFWMGPTSPSTILPFKRIGRANPVFRRIDHAYEIEMSSNNVAYRFVIDETTGFERISSYTQNQDFGTERRQWFPKVLPNGIAVPRLSIRTDFHGPNSLVCQVHLIEEVEQLDRVPSETFIVPIAPGTNVLDYRGISRVERDQGRQAHSGVVTTEMPDAIAYANRRDKPSPILKVGGQAPHLPISNWLNMPGSPSGPDRWDKTVVIVFMDVDRGSSVVQMDEVNRVAKIFANSKILIVGLHRGLENSQPIQAAIKEHKWTVPIAMDQPPSGRIFGNLFAEFTVPAVPCCAVVDSDGQLAYLGHFQRAMEIAKELAGN